MSTPQSNVPLPRHTILTLNDPVHTLAYLCQVSDEEQQLGALTTKPPK